MHILLMVLFNTIPALFSEKYKGANYLKNYDIVDCYIINPRTKRNFNLRNKSPKESFDAEVYFNSYDINFHLLLIEDIAFKKLKVESYTFDNSTSLEDVTVKIFEGIVNNETVPSYVVGYLYNNMFTGSIKLNETIYFVEPAKTFFSNYTFGDKIVVYREEDTFFENLTYNRKINYESSISINKHGFYFEENILPKGINKTKYEKEDYACAIEIVSDHTLYNYFGNNVDKLTAYLYLHGKYSDYIFRRADFDGNGKPDRIRIIIDKIFIYKTENDPDYPMKKTSNMNSFLDQFSYRIQNYCLSICMLCRISPDKTIGVAFKASDTEDKPPGGICQKPIPVSPYSSAMRSLNTAAVTILNHKGNFLPLSATLLAVAHELGHSFGSVHDSTDNVLCTPGSGKGFYLMYPKSQSKIKPLSTFFSPCSKNSIAAVITARGECLKPYSATCGNAVQEGDEECDCGKQVSCRYIDRCCTPSDAEPPAKGCTFLKSEGAVCSPREDKCCVNDCAINTDTTFQCHKDYSECLVSYCNGKSRLCPEPKVAPDAYPCRGTSRSCSGGICNSSVCVDNGLTLCVCNEVSLECHICCQKNNNCVSASSLGFGTRNGGARFYAVEGTLCNFQRFQCDGSGNCINPRDRTIAETKSSPVSFWWAIGGLVFALLIALSVLLYFTKQYYMKN